MITNNGIICGKEFNEPYSNFMVTGSPTIANGYASNLRPGHYIYIPVNIDTTKSKLSVAFEGILGAHKTSSASLVDLINSDNNYSCRLYENQYGGTDAYIGGAYGFPGGNVDMAESGRCRFEWSVQNTTATASYYEDGVLKKSGSKTIASGLGTVVRIRFGGEYSEWTGSLDLSSIVISENDIPIRIVASDKATISNCHITSTNFCEI